MTQIFAVVNQKGGVGKTTTTVNLATALVAVGQKVLIVDFDPQGNASTGLGVSMKESVKGSYEVIIDPIPVTDAIHKTELPGLSIIPSSRNLSGAEVELVNLPERDVRLKKALSRLTDFDYILIDCPPSLGLLTLNALVASQKVLVPLQCEFYALEGLSQLLDTLALVKKHLNPALELQGVVLTMYDTRSCLSSQVAADVREHLGDKVYKTYIPRNVRVAEAPSFGKPVLLYDLKCIGSQAYIQLAKELIAREKRNVSRETMRTKEKAA